MEYAKFVELAVESGVNGVTAEEFSAYVDGKLWTPKTALRMILNARASAEREAGKVKELLVGYPLGGSDFVYKGTSLETSKLQKIPFLTQDGIVELSQFGHFGAKHVTEMEVEVELSESEGKDGQVYTNRTVRDVRRTTENVLPLERLLELACHFSELTQDDLYEYRVIWGRIEKFELNAMFEDGAKTGKYPLVYDDKPSCAIIFKRATNFTRVNIGPAKLSVPYVLLDDMPAVFSSGSLDIVNQAYAGIPVLVVGRVRKIDYTERGDYITLMGTLVVTLPDTHVPDEPSDTPERFTPQSRFEIPATQVSMPAVSTAERVQGPSTERVAAVLDGIKDKIQEGRDILGDEFSVQGLYDLGLVSSSVPQATLEKLIRQLDE